MTTTENLLNEIEQLVLHAEENDTLTYSVLEHARKLVFTTREEMKQQIEPEKTSEQITAECEEDLKEIAFWFGGFDELRKVLDRLEEQHNDAAAERSMEPDYDAPSVQEQMEKAYKQKYSS